MSSATLSLPPLPPAHLRKCYHRAQWSSGTEHNKVPYLKANFAAWKKDAGDSHDLGTAENHKTAYGFFKRRFHITGSTEGRERIYLGKIGQGTEPMYVKIVGQVYCSSFIYGLIKNNSDHKNDRILAQISGTTEIDLLIEEARMKITAEKNIPEKTEISPKPKEAIAPRKPAKPRQALLWPDDGNAYGSHHRKGNSSDRSR